jgi:hypothetical protein
MKFRTFLLGVAALLVASCAAYFSVLGLSKLFAGASLEVIIMAGSLELAKLISAGFLYNYWVKLNKLLRGYLTTAVAILMLITSAGIYGFLTSAYKVTSDELNVINKQTEVIELKKERYEEELANYDEERSQLNQSINELSKGLANNVIQYRDTSGQLITTTSSATRRTLTAQLEDFKDQRNDVTTKMDVLNDSITSLDIQILELTSNNEVAAEIGPLRYISDITGKSMDSVVNWFALFIVLVFDPLAVTLVIAFSSAMKIDKGERDKKRAENSYKVYGEEKKEESEKKQTPMDKYGQKFGPGFTEAMNEIHKEMRKDESINESADESVSEGINEGVSEGVNENNEGINEDVGPVVGAVDGPNDEDKIVRIQGLTRAEYEAGGWREPFEGQPYYQHPWFDWKKSNRWVNDPKAVDFWRKFRGGNQSMLNAYKSNYPDNFDEKTY